MDEPALHGGEARGFATDLEGVNHLRKIIEKRLAIGGHASAVGDTMPSRIRKAVSGPLAKLKGGEQELRGLVGTKSGLEISQFASCCHPSGHDAACEHRSPEALSPLGLGQAQ